MSEKNINVESVLNKNEWLSSFVKEEIKKYKKEIKDFVKNDSYRVRQFIIVEALKKIKDIIDRSKKDDIERIEKASDEVYEAMNVWNGNVKMEKGKVYLPPEIVLIKSFFGDDFVKGMRVMCSINVYLNGLIKGYTDDFSVSYRNNWKKHIDNIEDVSEKDSQ